MEFSTSLTSITTSMLSTMLHCCFSIGRSTILHCCFSIGQTYFLLSFYRIAGGAAGNYYSWIIMELCTIMLLLRLL